jgi:large subunit ribosomal protein L6
MSRIGKKAVPIPAGVTADIADGQLSVKGPKGTLSLKLADNISYDVQGDQIAVTPANDTKQARAFWGMQRTLVQNLVTGVTAGFTKKLLITGVGYRAAAQGRKLNLKLGYSHDVDIEIPEGLDVKTPDATTVEISGADKQKVGQLAAEIRRWRKPEPTRARASSMTANSSSQGREEEVSKGLSLFEKRRRRNRSGASCAQRRSPAAACPSLGQAHLCAGDRRCGGPFACGGVDVGGMTARPRCGRLRPRWGRRVAPRRLRPPA